MSLLAVEGLNKRFGGVVAAKDVSFNVEKGEMVAIIGPNGAGKSTTFNMVGGQLNPDTGRVLLAGESITGLAPRLVWRKGIGRTFQIAQTFVSMSVVENVQMALISQGGETLRVLPDAAGLHRERALDLLGFIGMQDAAERPVRELAYGDVKRVELAIALASEPKLLLMDEPTAGMAPKERGGLMELTARVARERQIGVLFTEHDMDSVFGHADRILVLVRGQIIAAGTPEQVRADAKVKEVYLGDIGVAAAMKAKRAGQRVGQGAGRGAEHG
jgi:branched-chain amino acid transport system ATP-binding protein